MRAVTWQGRHEVRVDTVPDPEIVNPRDAIIKVTSTAICGSDLHLYDGYIPTMRAGDILGHEIHGRGGRDRAEEHAQEGPARRRPLHHLVRRLLLLREAAILRPATTPIPRPRRTCRRRSTATRWAAPSATRI